MKIIQMLANTNGTIAGDLMPEFMPIRCHKMKVDILKQKNSASEQLVTSADRACY